MSPPLLATKLFIPPPRAGAVLRPHLTDRLNHGLDRKLTLLSAPAGFGKTTLVCEWVAGLDRPVAWLSLDEADNDPSRFLGYLVAALQTLVPNIQEGVLGLLHARQPPPTEAILTVLLNKIAALPGSFVLVFDDYHVLDAVPIDYALTFLLDHLPPQMHLVIVTREDPNLPLARYRAQDQLTELRAADLRFTTDETAVFLNRVMGLNLSGHEIDALETRTEGWIAGLQLAAISLQGHQDTAAFIESFTGSHHFVMDYLVEEVLQRQPESVQAFLLHTSVLDRLSGPLCDALTEQDNSQATLDMLDNANLFLVPLDDERRWFRYHRLFADLLHQRQQLTERELTPTLHRRASQWYEQNGFVDEAIAHALYAEDFELAAEQIAGVADAVWASAVDTRLRHWLAGLPADLLHATPSLSIFHAWYLLAAGNQAEADRLLGTIERSITHSQDGAADADAQAQDESEGHVRPLQGRLATLQAFSAFYRGDVQAIIAHAGDALACLPAQDLSWRSTATHLLGDAYDFSGQIRDAYPFRIAAVQASNASGDVVQILIANLKLAINLRNQGRLQQVIEICRQQHEFANECGMAQTVVAGWLLAIWGEALAERHDLDGAVEKANLGVAYCEQGGDLAMLGWSYVCLIRVLFSRGEFTRAQESVHHMEALAKETYVPPWIMNLVMAWQARHWLAQGKLALASQWVDVRGLDASQAPHYAHEPEHFVLARILLAQGCLDEAKSLLQRLLAAAEQEGRTSSLIETLLLLALVHQAGRRRRTGESNAESGPSPR